LLFKKNKKMKKFVAKISLFSAILVFVIIILVILFSIKVEKRTFGNWNTESNLLILKPNTHYDLIFDGNSHSRNFSRHQNHKRVENILNKKILNIGRSGSLGGLNENLFYLQYFYDKGVTADTLILNIFSQMLYNKNNNLISNAFVDEPFKIDFFYKYAIFKYGQNKPLKLFYYLRSKLSFSWLKTKPLQDTGKFYYLDSINHQAIKEGFKAAYPNGIDTPSFVHNEIVIEQIIKTAQAHGTTVIFITTPTLFGHWPYHNDVVSLMQRMHKKYGTHYYDFALAINDPHFYYDHHHLNTPGVVYFVKNFLKPALNENDTSYLVF